MQDDAVAGGAAPGGGAQATQSFRFAPSTTGQGSLAGKSAAAAVAVQEGGRWSRVLCMLGLASPDGADGTGSVQQLTGKKQKKLIPCLRTSVRGLLFCLFHTECLLRLAHWAPGALNSSGWAGMSFCMQIRLVVPILVWGVMVIIANAVGQVLTNNVAAPIALFNAVNYVAVRQREQALCIQGQREDT